MKKYTSDLTEEKFSKIRGDLEGITKKTRPRKTDILEIFNAILYLLRNATRWRDIPKDYPNWKLVYYHFSNWKKAIDPETGEPLLEVVLKKIGGMKGRISKETTMIIIDSQSVKTTFLAKERGYDGGKKITGIKRHIGVDILGLPHMIGITTANISDRDGAKEMFLHYTGEERFDKLETILADGGYTGENLSQWANNCFDAKLQVVKRNELHKFKVLETVQKSV